MALPRDEDADVSSPPVPASPGAMDTAATIYAQPVTDLRAAATDLLVREEGALRRVIGRYVRDAATIDDLYQEVGLKMLRHLGALRDPAALRGWLYQLARNACLDHLRHQRRHPRHDAGALTELRQGGELGRNGADALLSAERVAAVRRALADLPAGQREVLRLRIDEDLDHLAIAARLGISREAVEVRLCRGRATLKERLTAIIEGEL